MLWRCQLEICRRDDEPMTEAEIRQLRDAVVDAGLTENALMDEPCTLHRNLQVLFYSKKAVELSDFSDAVERLSEVSFDYLFHMTGAECEDPDFELNITKVVYNGKEYTV